VLNGCKLEAMVDCTTTASHTKHDAYIVENNMSTTKSKSLMHFHIVWLVLFIFLTFFVSKKVFNDPGIPRDRDQSGEEVERHGQSDAYGRAVEIFAERTLIAMQTETIQDLEQ
jgi:hypothetical protein